MWLAMPQIYRTVITVKLRTHGHRTVVISK